MCAILHERDWFKRLKKHRNENRKSCDGPLCAVMGTTNMGTTMNGAECLLRTLLHNGVDTCFMNPGTSEMQFVAALDRVQGMRSVLCLFEGVCSCAADGYARMRRRPAE